MKNVEDEYFTHAKIDELVNHHGWEMVSTQEGKCHLRQRDNHSHTTIDFYAAHETIKAFVGNKRVS